MGEDELVDFQEKYEETSKSNYKLASQVIELESENERLEEGIKSLIEKWEERTHAYTGQLGIANRIAYEIINDLKTLGNQMKEIKVHEVNATIGFKPKEIPTMKYSPAESVATSIPKDIYKQEFKPLAEKYKLNNAELLRQMIYYCLEIPYEPKPREIL